MKVILGCIALTVVISLNIWVLTFSESKTYSSCEEFVRHVEKKMDFWSEADLKSICLMDIKHLEKPNDSTNRWITNTDAILLGKQFFFDTQFSSNRAVACATCHIPAKSFSDGLKLAQGIDPLAFNTPSLVGVAYTPWFFWDGRSDSLWSQALEPLESPKEHNIHRLQIAGYVWTSLRYKEEFREINPDLMNRLEQNPILLGIAKKSLSDSSPDDLWKKLSLYHRQLVNELFVMVGKVLASYVAQIPVPQNALDNYIDTLWYADADLIADQTHLNSDELSGLKLFLSKGTCISCHNGPLYSNFDFHNTGVSTSPQLGRLSGMVKVQSSPFNCKGIYNDERISECEHLKFMRNDHALLGTFKTPSLRKISLSSPYMHNGRLQTLEAVIDHYNSAFKIKMPAGSGKNEITQSLNLSINEKHQLNSFLNKL